MSSNTRVPAGTVLLATALALATGCSGGGGEPQVAERDREKAKSGWVLSLDDAGATSELPLDRMDIYLTESDGEPEMFEIHGPGVALAGVIPASIAVGYGEAFDRLVGKTLALEASGGDPAEPRSSSVTLGGVAYPVAGGSFTVEKVSGKWAGSEGDKTLHGAIELRVLGSGGERIVRGRIAVNAVTWG